MRTHIAVSRSASVHLHLALPRDVNQTRLSSALRVLQIKHMRSMIAFSYMIELLPPVVHSKCSTKKHLEMTMGIFK